MNGHSNDSKPVSEEAKPQPEQEKAEMLAAVKETMQQAVKAVAAARKLGISERDIAAAVKDGKGLVIGQDIFATQESGMAGWGGRGR